MHTGPCTLPGEIQRVAPGAITAMPSRVAAEIVAAAGLEQVCVADTAWAGDFGRQ